jgi:SAM-dependent methyltransferase
MSTPYDKEYYLGLREGSRRSAEVIVPLVCGWIHPVSVVDVGCGDGTWLSVFRQHGVREILGIDREYVTGEILQIPEEEFLRHDLRVPLSMDRVFDLVVSLEVAEHLPAEFAETFVDSLARLGPAILFSAAVPFQGGPTISTSSGRTTGWICSGKKDLSRGIRYGSRSGNTPTSNGGTARTS